MKKNKIRKTNRILFYSGIILMVSILIVPTGMSATWYYLPGYSNYCPKGLPDFNQMQMDLNATIHQYCGPTAAADILWWFDSKHDPTGTPGDGKDYYGLVQGHNGLDDHSSLNVKPLISELAIWMNTNGNANGTIPANLKTGLVNYIAAHGFSSSYTVSNWYTKPGPSYFLSNAISQNGVILCTWAYNGYYTIIPKWGHYIALQGTLSSPYQIKLSDPLRDIQNPTCDPFLHNDANIVSYDTWTIQLITVGVWKGYYQIMNYSPPPQNYVVVIEKALYINDL